MNNPLQRIKCSLPIEQDRSLVTDRRSLGTILWHLVSTIETKPVPPPLVPQDLTNLPFLLRIHACLRLFLLETEHRLSPGGQLGGFLRFVIRVTIVANATLLALAAVLAGVSAVTAIGAIISFQLRIIALNCFWALLAVLGCVLLLIAIALVVSLAARMCMSH